MFTGIVEDLGVVASCDARQTGARLGIRSALAPSLAEGSSIAVNGVCLTAVDIAGGCFAADLAPETLSRTNLGGLRAGSFVNLERPVTPATLLSGHIVQGHVDAAGEILSFDALGDGNWWLKVKLPATLDRYLVEKGSIALDGISLTIAQLDPGPVVHAAIIPHTYQKTRFRHVARGDRVNVEVDVLAKHVEKLLAGR